jgi:ketosteroid isomerase-like protein
MKLTWTLLLAAAMLSAPAFAEGVQDEILEAEKDWATAVVAGDLDRLDVRLDDTLIYAHSSGVIESKSGYLGRLRSGAQSYHTITHEKTTVRMHGDAAVAHSIGVMAGQNPAGPFDNHLMMMHTWVKASGVWRLAAHQTTNIVE